MTTAEARRQCTTKRSQKLFDLIVGMRTSCFATNEWISRVALAVEVEDGYTIPSCILPSLPEDSEANL